MARSLACTKRHNTHAQTHTLIQTTLTYVHKHTYTHAQNHLHKRTPTITRAHIHAHRPNLELMMYELLVARGDETFLSAASDDQSEILLDITDPV